MLVAPFAVALALAASGPTVATRPAVTGQLQEGKKLTATAGTWVGSGTITYAYQWYRCDAAGAHCNSIHGASKPTYTQVTKDVGRTVGLTVKATDRTGTTSAYSALVGLVALKTSVLVATSQPPVSGDPVVGQPLKVETATWSTVPKTFTYAWKRCNGNGRVCAPIAGATTDTYTVTNEDIGHVLVAAVTADGKQTVFSLGSGVGRAAPGPVLSAAPVVTGTPQQGKQLSAAPGTWSGSGTVTYAYQWYRCDAAGAHCSSIHGSTKPTYTQVATDVGKTIGLTVRATDSTGTSAGYAALTGLVAAASAKLVALTQPALTGTAKVGQVLSVSGGTWSPATTSFTYAWLRCNANGRVCTAIAGATAATYTLAAADSGHTIVATLTATVGTATQAVLTVASPLVTT
jgi:hypothetical protein